MESPAGISASLINSTFASILLSEPTQIEPFSPVAKLYMFSPPEKIALLPSGLTREPSSRSTQQPELVEHQIRPYLSTAVEYTVSPDSEITKYPVKDLDFPKNAIICGVQRGSQAMIAVGDTRIEAYDKVAVFALPENLKEIDRFFK